MQPAHVRNLTCILTPSHACGLSAVEMISECDVADDGDDGSDGAGNASGGCKDSILRWRACGVVCCGGWRAEQAWGKNRSSGRQKTIDWWDADF
eukprot:7108642-Alexandrium_andersonii.AAC.1